jgi:hypothetical protein
MEIFTLASVCDCSGDTVIIGVFESMDAVIERLRFIGAYTDPGEGYKIECFQLSTFEEESKRTKEMLITRAEYKAKQERDQKKSESSEA